MNMDVLIQYPNLYLLKNIQFIFQMPLLQKGLIKYLLQKELELKNINFRFLVDGVSYYLLLLTLMTDGMEHLEIIMYR